MYMHYVSIVLVTLMASTISQEVLTTSIRTFNNYKILQSYTTLATTRRSMAECFSYCASISSCWSASWNPTEKMCLGTNVLFVENRAKISEHSSNWKMAAMMRFPVFNMAGPLGRYTLYSILAAEQLCNSNGAIIADREDLLTARAMGFDPCACGFMSDGSKGFVMQNPNWVCWGSFSTDIVSCDEMFGSNVWCKLPD